MTRFGKAWREKFGIEPTISDARGAIEENVKLKAWLAAKESKIDALCREIGDLKRALADAKIDVGHRDAKIMSMADDRDARVDGLVAVRVRELQNECDRAVKLADDYQAIIKENNDSRGSWGALRKALTEERDEAVRLMQAAQIGGAQARIETRETREFLAVAQDTVDDLKDAIERLEAALGQKVQPALRPSNYYQS